MAELATIGRPYAEALFKASAGSDAKSMTAQMAALAAVTADAQLRRFADDPKADSAQVVELITGVAQSKGLAIDDKIANLLRTVVENGRLAALPEIASQFQALVNASGGVADAVIYSAFELGGTQLADVVAALEKRFGRRLNARVKLDPELIGGIRAVVGDEVLDTSVRARLQQMKVALTA